jgi:hypothetical protein
MELEELTELDSVKAVRKNQVENGCHAVVLENSDTREVRVKWLRDGREDYHLLATNKQVGTVSFMLFEEKSQ